jgi:hypothetical protein
VRPLGDFFAHEEPKLFRGVAHGFSTLTRQLFANGWHFQELHHFLVQARHHLAGRACWRKQARPRIGDKAFDACFFHGGDVWQVVGATRFLLDTAKILTSPIAHAQCLWHVDEHHCSSCPPNRSAMAAGHLCRARALLAYRSYS